MREIEAALAASEAEQERLKQRHAAARAELEKKLNAEFEQVAERLDALHDEIHQDLAEIKEEGHRLDVEACRAIQHDQDVRPALAKYLRGWSALHGVSVAEVVPRIAHQGLLDELSIRSLGLSLTAVHEIEEAP